MSVIIPVDLDLADFIPKRRRITNVTNAKKAIVTTAQPHGYETGQFVRLHVFDPNPMVIDGIKVQVTIDSNDPNNDVNFVTDYDTSNLFSFVAPTFPPAFTQAHCVPITGDGMNEAESELK